MIFFHYLIDMERWWTFSFQEIEEVETLGDLPSSDTSTHMKLKKLLNDLMAGMWMGEIFQSNLQSMGERWKQFRREGSHERTSTGKDREVGVLGDQGEMTEGKMTIITAIVTVTGTIKIDILDMKGALLDGTAVKVIAPGEVIALNA